MSKGHGTGPSGGDARKTAGASIRRIGGISEAQFLRSGMRTESLAYARKPYSGKSASEAQRIAAHLKEPVTVGVYVGGRVQLIDGRHRAQAAKAAGATKIRAKVIVYGPRGGIVRTYIGKVPL